MKMKVRCDTALQSAEMCLNGEMPTEKNQGHLVVNISDAFI